MLAIFSMLGIALLVFALISRERPTLFEFVAVASLIAAVITTHLYGDSAQRLLATAMAVLGGLGASLFAVVEAAE